MTERENVDRTNVVARELMEVMARLDKDLPLAGMHQIAWLSTHADDVRAVIAQGSLDALAKMSGIKRPTILRWLRQREKEQRAVVVAEPAQAGGYPQRTPEEDQSAGRVTYVTDSSGEYWRGVSEGLERALRIVCGRDR